MSRSETVQVFVDLQGADVHDYTLGNLCGETLDGNLAEYLIENTAFKHTSGRTGQLQRDVRAHTRGGGDAEKVDVEKLPRDRVELRIAHQSTAVLAVLVHGNVEQGCGNAMLQHLLHGMRVNLNLRGIVLATIECRRGPASLAQVLGPPACLRPLASER